MKKKTNKIKKTTKKASVKVAKTTGNGKTHVLVILDRSGSMISIKTDTIGGFNTFLADQKKAKVNMTLTLVQFDSGNPYEVVYDTMPIANVPDLTPETFMPRGSTPLLDSMGKSMSELEAKIAHMDKQDRPEKVVVVIITDGQENASHEYTKQQISDYVAKMEEKAVGWKFVYLSSDLAAVNDAAAYGISRASTMSYDNNTKGVRCAYNSMSNNVTSFALGMVADVTFSDEDRSKQENEKKVKTK